MSDKIIKCGVVGLGRGTAIARCLKGVKNAKLVSVCDHNPAILKSGYEELSEVLEDKNLIQFSDYDEFLKSDIDAVIVATGGASYPLTGSTGDGYTLAKQVGHTITDLKPSLVPLECHEGWCTDAQGLSLRNVEIRVEDNKTYKEVYKDFGEMLFTHYGVSGPMILSASSHMRNMERGRYTIHIDFKPALTYEQLDKRIQRDLLECSNKNLYNTLALMLPRKMIPIVVKLSGLNGNIKSNQVTKEMRGALVELLKDIRLTVTDFRPIDEAIITSGGVSVSEIDPKTMKSKLVDGLYFAGEVIDVDAYTGGFNLQIAFSTGHLAGNSVSQ